MCVCVCVCVTCVCACVCSCMCDTYLIHQFWYMNILYEFKTWM